MFVNEALIKGNAASQFPFQWFLFLFVVLFFPDYKPPISILPSAQRSPIINVDVLEWKFRNETLELLVCCFTLTFVQRLFEVILVAESSFAIASIFVALYES